MKHLIRLTLCILFYNSSIAQEANYKRDTAIDNTIKISHINGFNVINSDTLIQFLRSQIDQRKKSNHFISSYPRIYFTNNNSNQYLEIWAAPDIGFGAFYSIGYTDNSICSYCGNKIGKIDAQNFYIDSSVELGMDISEVSAKINLPVFRRFYYKGTLYLYYEKGVAQEVPFTSKFFFFFKFKSDKLIEIGLGKGFMNLNPMFQPE